MEITIQLPESLGQKLQLFQDRLPEVIERGLRELLAESQAEFSNGNLLETGNATNVHPTQMVGH